MVAYILLGIFSVPLRQPQVLCRWWLTCVLRWVMTTADEGSMICLPSCLRIGI